MFSFIRTRFGIPGGVAVVALVFAMAGGALAAKGVIITKLNQISPGVQKQLKGKAGPAGAPGAKGDTGAKGDSGGQGAKGDPGQAGSSGTNGESVTITPVNVGAVQCEERGGSKFSNATGASFACTGEQGGFGVLPSNATETGTWGWFNGGEAVEGGFSAVSFPARLPAPITGANTHTIPSAGVVPAECDDGVLPAPAVENPEADPGHFCLFVGAGTETSLTEVKKPSGTPGAGVTGATLVLEGNEGGSLAGTWAVTAE